MKPFSLLFRSCFFRSNPQPLRSSNHVHTTKTLRCFDQLKVKLKNHPLCPGSGGRFAQRGHRGGNLYAIEELECRTARTGADGDRTTTAGEKHVLASCYVRSYLLLVVRPGAPSSILAPSSDARSS